MEEIKNNQQKNPTFNYYWEIILFEYCGVTLYHTSELAELEIWNLAALKQ